MTQLTRALDKRLGEPTNPNYSFATMSNKPKPGKKKASHNLHGPSELAKTASAVLAGAFKRLSGGTLTGVLSPQLVEEEDNHGDAVVLSRRPDMIAEVPAPPVRPTDAMAPTARAGSRPALPTVPVAPTDAPTVEPLYDAYNSQIQKAMFNASSAGQARAPSAGKGPAGAADARATKQGAEQATEAPGTEPRGDIDQQRMHGDADAGAPAGMAPGHASFARVCASLAQGLSRPPIGAKQLACVLVVMLAAGAISRLWRPPPTNSLTLQVAELTQQVQAHNHSISVLQLQLSAAEQHAGQHRAEHAGALASMADYLQQMERNMSAQVHGVLAQVASPTAAAAARPAAEEGPSSDARAGASGFMGHGDSPRLLAKCHPASLADMHGPLAALSVVEHSPVVTDGMLHGTALALYRTLNSVLRPHEGSINPLARMVVRNAPGGACLALAAQPPGASASVGSAAGSMAHATYPYLTLQAAAPLQLQAISFIYPQPGSLAALSPSWTPGCAITRFRLSANASRTDAHGNTLSYAHSETVDISAPAQAAAAPAPAPAGHGALDAGCFVFRLEGSPFPAAQRFKIEVLASGGAKHVCFPQLLLHAAHAT